MDALLCIFNGSKTLLSRCFNVRNVQIALFRHKTTSYSINDIKTTLCAYKNLLARDIILTSIQRSSNATDVKTTLCAYRNCLKTQQNILMTLFQHPERSENVMDVKTILGFFYETKERKKSLRFNESFYKEKTDVCVNIATSHLFKLFKNVCNCCLFSFLTIMINILHLKLQQKNKLLFSLINSRKRSVFFLRIIHTQRRSNDLPIYKCYSKNELLIFIIIIIIHIYIETRPVLSSRDTRTRRNAKLMYYKRKIQRNTGKDILVKNQ